ncbi:MAG: VWA domain-containing protein [Acidobacteriaceae bacterium]|nr:VWA domain-containing protein [Acidobacteriaceae bacterium]
MRVFLPLIAVLAALPAAAQQDAPKPKIGSPVSVPVIVRDKKGDTVSGLALPNFSLKVEGVAQKLDAVNPGSSVTYGLVVDVSKGERHSLEAVRKGARSLISSLQPGDQMFVVQFARQIELLQGPTTDHARLDRALDLLGTSSPSFQPDDPPMERGDDAEGRRIRTGGVSLEDAVYLSSEEVLAREKTRRVLLVVSDGVDVGSKMSATDAMESLERTGTLVYGVYSRNDAAPVQTPDRAGQGRGSGNGRPSIGGYPGSSSPGSYPGSGYPGGGGSSTPSGGSSGGQQPKSTGDDRTRRPSVDGVQVLRKMSENTGGRLLEQAHHETLEEQMATVSGDLHAAYWLSFAPVGPAARNGYHAFDLQVSGPDKGKKIDLQAPEGYYAAD